ncbi:anthranilate synthase component I [Streptomyces sp. WMMC1477]|uniref:anthranilate synthase component I n=1 Tax=Streptomyces sp. WMMC1477 TaxID=3015155 RepID=UPI0022B68E41|nr:anthranilate synthase component I [Streptomyces sp. WMMC1477]MCZ7432388.1 anthranilate synthase component I [Streptomyces sp. WMMC1477]
MTTHPLPVPLPREWTTDAGVRIECVRTPVDGASAMRELEDALDTRRGAVLRSDYESPDRYRRHAVGYTDPPVEIVVRGLRTVEVRALNARGEVLLPVLRAAARRPLRDIAGLGGPGDTPGFTGQVRTTPGQDLLSEEDRPRRPGAFDFVRAVRDAFSGPAGDFLGLYGAFGYDLVLAFDPVPPRQSGRSVRDRDLVLHLPDAVTVTDPVAGTAWRHTYEFTAEGRGTHGLPRLTPAAPFRMWGEHPADGNGPVADGGHGSDHAPGEYADLVRTARERFRAGDLFEVVPSRTFDRPVRCLPSDLFRALRTRNPSPYQMLMNLGEGEHLVGTSPEMFVRVHPRPTADGTGWRVESAPISGTAARGRDALEDAEQVKALLASEKEEAELTMCTDVDRNDKSRVCEPGSVRVIGRRQLEMYATLIHTVDHVEGVLRHGRDALDAFLSHMWAVTVTGAPKHAAIAFLEEHERSPRRWYGGAVGRVGFDGSLDTGLTLRTVQLRDGRARVRTGATLLYESVPEAEERETELKALALLEVLGTTAVDGAAPGAATAPDTLPGGTARRSPAGTRRTAAAAGADGSGYRPRVLLVDHQDSFVHTLAAYLRQAGARVSTYRSGFDPSLVEDVAPDLLVLSPGPGRPEDHDTARTLRLAEDRGIPVFGVCLGMQAIVEHLGGRLAVLDRPFHGRSSTVSLVDDGGALLRGLPPRFSVGRYHSLIADATTLPPELRVTARCPDGAAMALEHHTRPLAGVQFHPESLMTQFDDHGQTLIGNVLARLARRPQPAGSAPAPDGERFGNHD